MLQAVPQLLDVGVQARETLVCIAPVDIAEGDNVLAGKVDEVLAAHAANADAGDVQQIARRCETPSEHAAGHKGRGSTTGRRGAQEFPARQSLLFVAAGLHLVFPVFFLFLHLFSHNLSRVRLAGNIMAPLARFDDTPIWRSMLRPW